jgi:hypothetical protein
LRVRQCRASYFYFYPIYLYPIYRLRIVGGNPTWTSRKCMYVYLVTRNLDLRR